MIDISSETTIKGKVKLITDELEKGIKDLFESEKYKEYLRTMSKFHNYSFNNSLLIMMQKPDATYVAGLQKWNKEFKRYINKNEKGIVILVPTPYKKTIQQNVFDADGNLQFDKDGNALKEEKTIQVQAFKPGYVYDISQTHGQALPKIMVDELTGSVESYSKIFEAVKEIAPVDISFEKITSGAKGYYDQMNKRIVINEDMSEVQSVKTLIHETAHALLHDKDFLKSTGESKDRQTKEVEAESVAFTVCSYLNLPTEEYSFGYIAGWSAKQIDVLKESLENIKECSSSIIGELEKRLVPQETIQLNVEVEQNYKSKALAV